MSRTPSLEPTIRAAVQQFTSRVAAFVEGVTVQRIQSAILGNLGAPVRRGPGRPPKNAAGLLGAGPLSPFSAVGAGKRRPKQLCPVPGCKNPAAPVFGMVCAEHKSVPKSKIKEYREARRRAQKAAAGKGGSRAQASAGKMAGKGARSKTGVRRAAKRGGTAGRSKAAAGRSAPPKGKKRRAPTRKPAPSGPATTAASRASITPHAINGAASPANAS